MNTASDPTRLLVCVNERLGGARPACAGHRLVDALAAEIGRRGLPVRVEPFICFGVCAEGPNVRLAPGGRFFHHVTTGEVPAIVEAAAAFAARRDAGPPGDARVNDPG